MLEKIIVEVEKLLKICFSVPLLPGIMQIPSTIPLHNLPIGQLGVEDQEVNV
jgi:hypothetical protein